MGLTKGPRMKASEPGGRFSIPYERRSILSGIGEDQRRPVGQHVQWWKWDSTDTVIDDIYDVGSVDGGRMWYPSFDVPCVMAVIYQGATLQDERGFYNTDILRITMNMLDVEELLPGIVNTPDDYLRDRIVFRGEVFRPTRFYPRGLIKSEYTVFTLDANQVNPEEMINDSQFLDYAN